MVNTFSDSPHKAAVFKSADKVHSNVLEVLQHATHTTQCLYKRRPALSRAARWMGLYVWRGKICGLSPENGVQLACAVPCLETLGLSIILCLGQAVELLAWQGGTEQHSTSVTALILYEMLRSRAAAPLFKRGVHKFLWLVLLSLLRQLFLVGLLTLFVPISVRLPFPFTQTLSLVQSWALDGALLLSEELFSFPWPKEEHLFFRPYTKSSLVRLILGIREFF